MTDFANHYFRHSSARLRTCVIGLAIACAAFGGDSTNKNLNRAEHALKSGDFQRAEQIYRELLTFMMADPGTINRATHLLWAAHNLERIADRVTNICERVVFTVTGALEEMAVSTY